MTSPIEYQADHTLLLALPAFAPALVVVGVVVYIAMRDRRQAGDGDASQDDVVDSSGEDGSP
ncbi:hypothetical protein ABQF34_00560 [Mycolicibacterium boenickei]